jgi:hypothetical protein
MKQMIWAIAIGVSGWALGHVGVPRAHADGAACGGKGQPSCPLQGWMETEMDAAEKKGDAKKLAETFKKVIQFSPDPGWSEWTSISNAGAEAASKGDLVAAKAQCKTCHKAFREKYKKAFRTRALPRM